MGQPRREALDFSIREARVARICRSKTGTIRIERLEVSLKSASGNNDKIKLIPVANPRNISWKHTFQDIPSSFSTFFPLHRVLS